MTEHSTANTATEKTILEIARALAAPVNEHFLDDLLCHTSEVLGAALGVIATGASADSLQIQTVFKDSQASININNLLSENAPDNPAIQIFSSAAPLIIKQSLKSRFPQCTLLSATDYESCQGVSLIGDDNTIIGVLIFFNRHPVSDPALNSTLLELLRSRLTSEIIRQQMETRFRLVCSATTDAIYEKDPDRGTLWWSEGARALFEQGEASGFTLKDWETAIHPDDREKVINSFFLACQNGQSIWRCEYRIRRPTGQYRHVLDRATIQRNEHDEIIAITGGLSDISERKHLEEQLYRATRLESIGQLAGGIAHDFNNLLTVILSGTDFALEMLPADSELIEDLIDVSEAAHRATTLTRQLLAFSRQQLLAPGNLDLNELVRSLSKLLGRVINEKIQVTLELADTLPDIFADPGHIEQAIFNLAINAQDAMPEGGTLLLQTRSLQTGHQNTDAVDTVELVINDTGVGIPEKDLKYIFEPFYSRKQTGEGSGLGLAAVDGIIRQSGGRISAESTIDKGTTFIISFPVAAADSITALNSTADSFVKGNETILVVEDAEEVARMTEHVLSGSGYQVLKAADAETAITLLGQQSTPPALVITDRVLPGMSGTDLLKWIQSIWPDMKIIVTSGYADLPELKISTALRFLPKPYSIASLRNLVRELLDKQ